MYIAILYRFLILLVEQSVSVGCALLFASLQVIVRHGEPAERFCNKDPFTMKSAGYLSELFPHAKFLFMLRDGRATVHSIITRKITITGFKLDSYRFVRSHAVCLCAVSNLSLITTVMDPTSIFHPHAEVRALPKSIILFRDVQFVQRMRSEKLLGRSVPDFCFPKYSKAHTKFQVRKNPTDFWFCWSCKAFFWEALAKIFALGVVCCSIQT